MAQQVFKSANNQANSMLYEKPVLDDNFYSNSYKDGYKIKGNEARLGKGRLDYLIDEYGVWNDNSDYSKAYLGYIDPREFIRGTSMPESSTGRELANQPELDIDRVNRERQTPFLYIDFDNNIVKGHEGRHRLSSFAKSGITRVPIVVRDFSPSFKKDKATRKTYKGTMRGQRDIDVTNDFQLDTDLIPINYKNAQLLREMFGE